jgi:Domain of unknown function (DUF4337)
MALHDSILNLLNKQPKDPDAPKPPVGSRSEREAKIKDKAGMVINVFALLLALNAWYGGKLSSTVLNNTIASNDTYAFYQAKSLKQSLAEQNLYEAQHNGDKARAEEMKAKIEDYENGPEGKLALLAKAKQMEADRDAAKKSSPWIGYASTAYQLSIVILSASILAVSMPLFWSSFLVAGLGLLLSLNGLFLFF